MNFATAITEDQAMEIMRRAMRGERLTEQEILGMYANPLNWRREYDKDGCKYVWKGPVICAYEGAGWVLRA